MDEKEKMLFKQAASRDFFRNCFSFIYLCFTIGVLTLVIWSALNLPMSTWEAIGLGTILGIVFAGLKDIIQFYYRKSGSNVKA